VGRPFYTNPWFLVVAGMACPLVGRGLAELPSLSAVLDPLRFGLFAAGTLLTVLAVVRRLRSASWDLTSRLSSSGLVALAGLAALESRQLLHPDWDSFKLFYVGLFLAALFGAVLILLPPLARKVVLTAVILFHFGGMATAITSVDPPNSTGSWLSKQLWTYAYRPYLQFMYLTNAYHFYSPDPGPPSLFWFAVKYSDGSYVWVKTPHRENSPIGMHYQRMLALPEHSFTGQPRLPYTAMELAVQPLGTELGKRGSWEEISHRRLLGSTLKYGPKGLPIPMVLGLDGLVQYREPTDPSKKIVAAVARRALWKEAPRREGLTPVSVKMYRVTHLILLPKELAEGVSPLDKPKHWPYFLGEFDREGKLVDSRDPFLYWLVPIVIVPPDYPNHGIAQQGAPGVFMNVKPPKDGFLLDGLEMHAGGPTKNPEDN
jgi:hypothetical protein